MLLCNFNYLQRFDFWYVDCNLLYPTRRQQPKLRRNKMNEEYANNDFITYEEIVNHNEYTMCPACGEIVHEDEYDWECDVCHNCLD